VMSWMVAPINFLLSDIFTLSLSLSLSLSSQNDYNVF
jgi:hypothetical protein